MMPCNFLFDQLALPAFSAIAGASRIRSVRRVKLRHCQRTPFHRLRGKPQKAMGQRFRVLLVRPEEDVARFQREPGTWGRTGDSNDKFPASGPHSPGCAGRCPKTSLHYCFARGIGILRMEWTKIFPRVRCPGVLSPAGGLGSQQWNPGPVELPEKGWESQVHNFFPRCGPGE